MRLVIAMAGVFINISVLMHVNTTVAQTLLHETLPLTNPIARTDFDDSDIPNIGGTYQCAEKCQPTNGYAEIRQSYDRKVLLCS
jgi:hypothetical protein